jgi:uracil-DNA glycosylase
VPKRSLIPNAVEPPEPSDGFQRLHNEICDCRVCPRLVKWREDVAVERKAAYRDEVYWGRPVPGFGDESASVLVLGLAPAAHGANRTGRVFTGDRSGDWLFRALHRAGFANQPTSVSAGDGLELTNCRVVAAVRCAPPANKPTIDERNACIGFLRREIALLTELRVVLALGKFAYDVIAPEFGIRPRPPFGHGVQALGATSDGRPVAVVCSYHPSQQNTFTGTLTEAMFDDVVGRVAQIVAR